MYGRRAPVKSVRDKHLEDPKNIRQVNYLGCKSKLRLLAVTYRGEKWCLITDDQQERWVRLWAPAALKNMITSYAYLDTLECLNVADGQDGGVRVYYGAPYIIRQPCFLDQIEYSLRNVRGIKQLSSASGICWYAAMVFVMLFSRPMRKLFLAKADPVLRKHFNGVLTNTSRAEKLRHHLYYAYRLGDRPGQPPHMDGQNGFSQLAILLARLDIPTIRLFAPTLSPIKNKVIDKDGNEYTLRVVPKKDETSLLVVRCLRTRWVPKARIKYQVHPDRPPLVYRLIGLLIGSEYCEHQVAASATSTTSTHWALSDADATRLGIGPLFWTVRRRPGESRTDHMKRWRATWRQILPATRFGNKQVCDFNPFNRPSRALERPAQEKTSGEFGVVNTDCVYIHIP